MLITVPAAACMQGVTTLSFVLGCWALARGVGVPRRARLAANCMAVMAMTQVWAGSLEGTHNIVLLPPLTLQVGLGISTLLMYVPTSLAAAHQSGSLTLLSLAIWLMSELRKKAPRL